LLKVGPRSAGADPGPACYDRGNDKPTVTDANVVLGTLNPTHLLGGRIRIQADLAQAAIDRIAAPLGIDTLAAAQGVIPVVTANMARAIRVISDNAAMTRAITPWSRSVVPDRCTRRGSRPSWTSAACWCRATPASFVPWAC
jgi:N-methylhydantoinase A/oxoprolinase/acetone carboxylase beta subunit